MIQAFLTTSALNETTNGVLGESPPRSGHRVPAQSELHQMNQNIISQMFFFGQCHQLLQTPGNASYSHHMRLCVADDKQDPMTRCTSVGSDKNLEMIDVIWHYIVNKAELNSIDSGSKDLALTPNGSQVAIAESVEVLVSIHQYASFSVASPDPFTYVTCA